MINAPKYKKYNGNLSKAIARKIFESCKDKWGREIPLTEREISEAVDSILPFEEIVGKIESAVNETVEQNGRISLHTLFRLADCHRNLTSNNIFSIATPYLCQKP